jgi:DUF4097 and DUF4098 domain-containing protein YvlB
MSSNAVTRRTNIIAAFLLVASAALFAADYERVDNRTMKWCGDKVSVDHRYGDVRIRVHEANTVVMHAVVRASSAETLREIKIVVTECTDGVSIRTEYPESVLGNHIRINNYTSYAVDMELTVPAAAALYVRNKFGDLDVDGLRVSSDVATAHGKLLFRNSRGQQRLENQFGTVEASTHTGDISIRNSNGDVTVQNIDGNMEVFDRFGTVSVADVLRNATISNANGTVELSQVGGTAIVTTSFAPATVTDVKGDATVNSNNGKVEVQRIGGSATIKASFAPVHFAGIGRDLACTAQNAGVRGENVTGTVNVRTSFASVDLSHTGPATVNNENGSVTLTDVRGNAVAGTRFAGVRLDGVKGSVDVTNANGGVNVSGAGSTKVRTSFASVFVRDVAAPVTVENQNGSISVEALRTGGRCAAVNLRTSFAPIEVDLPAGGYSVTAQTSFGSITSDVEIEALARTTGSATTLNGRIGNGECQVQLTNQNGNIRIGK